MRSPQENSIEVDEENMSDDSNCYNMNSNVYSQNVVEDDILSSFSGHSRTSFNKTPNRENLLHLTGKRKA